MVAHQKSTGYTIYMITIYSTRTCGFCHAAKQYLTGQNIPYEEVKVDEIPQGAEMLLEKSGQLGVPVIDVDGDIIIGFNRPALDHLIREKNITPTSA
jgi:glutaredoxin 3